MALAYRRVALLLDHHGIGEGIAEAFAKAGACAVVVAARRADRLASVCERIKAAGSEAKAVVTDVTDAAAVKALVAETTSAFGRLDVLVNNAGVMLLSMASACQLEQWHRMVDVNIKGVLNGVAAALPVMQQQQSGHILNISSDADSKVFPGSSVYSGTKAFVTLFSQGVQSEMSAKKLPVKVTSISLGACESELGTHITDPDVLAAPFSPPQHILKPSDIGDACVYAVSCPTRVAVHNILLRPMDQAS